MSNTFKKMTRVVSWLMTLAIAMMFALPADAIEFFPTEGRYQWVSQSGTLSSDGTAHEYYVQAGDTVSMSLTIKNRTIDPAAQVWYGIPPGGNLLPEDAPYRGAHELRVGVKNDEVLSWIDESSFLLNEDGDNNRFAVYDGVDAYPGDNLTFTWDVKIAEGTTDGVYDLYSMVVREFDSRFRQVNSAGALVGSDDVFWRFHVGDTSSYEGGGDLGLALSSSTPEGINLAELSTDVPMAKIKFTADSADNVIVSKIAVRKTGLSDDGDISDIKLYDGDTKIGSTQGINTSTHKASFTGLSWLIPAGTTKTLTIKATVPSAASVGDIIVLGIQSADDIELSGGGNTTGSFPIYGNEFTVASISVGYLAVTAPTTPADNNVISGSTDQDLASYKFETSSTEGFDVNSITLTEIGTSVASDVENLELTYLGDQIGSTVESLDGDTVTFTGSPLFSIKAGISKTIYLRGDIASGVTSSRTIRFEINDTPDVVAIGQSSSGAVTITADTSGTAYSTAQGNTMTIVQGTITVIKAPTNLSAQEYIVGEEQVEISKFKFSAGSREGVKVTKLIFNEDKAATSTDYQNARLYIDDSETPIDVGGSISTTTITFEDGNGLFEVPKSGNTEITLKIDVSTAAAATDEFRIGIGAAAAAYTNITMYGLTSGEKIDQDSNHMTLTSVSDGDMSTHTIAAKGSLTVSNGPSTPAASSFALGTDDFEFHQFRIQASSEAARVTAITVRFYDDTAVAGDDSGNGATTGDVINAKLYWLDGDTWTLLDEYASPSTGVASFSFDHTIGKNTIDTFKVVGDIPTSASLTNLFTGVAGTGDGYNIYDEVTATGVSSGASYTTGDISGLSDSSLFTKAVPILKVAKSTIPGARTIVKNSTDILLAKFFLTANDVEDIKVSTIKIFAGQDADDMADESAAAEDFANVYLRFDDGGEWRTTNPDNMTAGSSAADYVTFSGSDFNNPTEWVVPKGGSIIVEIRGDLVATTDSTIMFGMDTTATNVVASGLSSGTSATIYDEDDNAYNKIWESPELTLSDNGSLAVALATDTPSVQMVTASYGSTVVAPTFTRIKLSATNEDIDVDAMRVTTNADANDDAFSSATDGIKIYEGGTMSGNTLTGGTLVGSGALINIPSAADAVDIVFDETVTIEKDASKYLTIVADLNSVAYGVDSISEVPKLGVDYNVQTGIWDSNYSSKYNIRSVGSQSGATVRTAAAADLTGNAVVIAKTKLGMDVHSTSPSGTATRHADHTIFKLAMTNTSTNQDTLFRAGAAQYTAGVASAGVGTWTKIGSTPVVGAETTNYVTGSGSVKVAEDGSAAAGDGMYWKADAVTDLSDYERVSFWFRTSVAIGTAGDVQFEIDNTDALASPLLQVNIPVLNANTWYRVDAALGSAIATNARYWGITIAANHATYNDATFYLDNIVFYKDSLTVDLSSNAGLFNTTGATGQVVYLKDGSTTLATGYVSGTGTAKLSTSNAEVTFIPTTEMAIPASGKTYSVVSDTTTLMTATSRDLTMNVGLGSADSAGTITEGDVLWSDNSYTLNIGWIDSTETSLTRSLNF